VHPIWLSDLLRAENDQVAGLLKQPDKQKPANQARLRSYHEHAGVGSDRLQSKSCPENGDRTTPPKTLGVLKTGLCHGT